MPSPFPGMDPYLEHPDRWTGVHHRFLTYSADRLQEQLGKGYRVAIEERVYVEFEKHPTVPDVHIASRPRGAEQPAATLTLPAADAPTRVLFQTKLERVEHYLEIRAKDGNRLLTVIELLSPTNKRAGEGRDLYKKKQREVLSSSASLVEIDLLRAGEPTIAAPPEDLGPEAYRVLVSRAPEHERRELYAVGLRTRLPRVAIPVAPSVPDVLLDLPAIVTEVYEKGKYAEDFEYSEPPVPPLSPDDAAWARALVSLRPKARP